MAYADFTFYQGTYKGGRLSENAFEQFSERASDYIDSRTEYILHKSGIPPDLEVRIKKACCAIAETLYNCESGGTKLSESVDGYSVSYAATAQRTTSQKLDDTIQLYIADLIKAVRWI